MYHFWLIEDVKTFMKNVSLSLRISFTYAVVVKPLVLAKKVLTFKFWGISYIHFEKGC